ncbi:MAG: SIMPL domain-containing protein [Candidatus Zixiibacteriota bacterium]
MKKLSLILFIFICGLFAQAENGTITVEGHAEIIVDADYCKISVNIEAKGKSGDDAYKAAKNNAKNLIDQLDDIGFEKEKIKIPSLTTSKKDAKRFIKTPNEYKARIRANITIDDLSLISQAIRIISSESDMTISYVEFSVEDIPALKEEAITKALEAAEKKAEFIALKIETKLGKPIEIIENFTTIESYNSDNTAKTANSIINISGDNTQSNNFDSDNIFEMKVKASAYFKVKYSLK